MLIFADEGGGGGDTVGGKAQICFKSLRTHSKLGRYLYWVFECAERDT